jgi:hypothetical protein
MTHDAPHGPDRIARPVGRVRLEVWETLADGSRVLIDQWTEFNLVVAGASTIWAALAGGAGGAQPVSMIGFGTNGTAASSTDTTLTSSYTKAVDSISFPAAGQVQFNFSLGSSEANGMNIAEFGLLTAAGVLMARKARATGSGPIAKTSSISFTGSWMLQF